VFVVAILQLVTRVAAAAVEALGSARWEMPCHVFPPESFGPCAIAGEKFVAVSKASAAPASNKVFISVLRDLI